LRAEGCSSLLEVGAGTGIHGKFFKDEGLDVVCTDLSPEHVRRCEQRGLTAYVMDFMSLDFGGRRFDAVFAMNCLLHVPSASLPAVLERISNVITPGGLFYLGQYGGYEWEGPSEEDQRFFSFLSDERLREVASGVFTEIDFRRLERDFPYDQHYQALLMRSPAR
jgi:SAM-dependent methyltransferase